jgi:hypothetical protein
MRGVQFTPAQDRALFAAILALPVQRIACAILFLSLWKLPDRDRIVALIAAGGG